MPHIPKDSLSIIVTTSPIQSHPSTNIIDQSLQSLIRFESLSQIPIYIICDGAKISPNEDKYKTGIVTDETFQKYKQYIQIIREKYNDQNKYIIVERQQRNGFAQNIKFAMQNLAKTDHVMIYQHDHVIDGDIDFYRVLETMKKYTGEINYITFMNKSYSNIIPKLLVNKQMKKLLLQLGNKTENFNAIAKVKQLTSGICQHFNNKFGLPLVPLNFWYDKVHIASRKYYLDVIFNPKGNYDPHIGKNQKTMSFVEDSFGHCMKWSIEEKPQLILSFGVYVLWSQQSVFYHSKGRSYLTKSQKQQKYIKPGKIEKENLDILKKNEAQYMPFNFSSDSD